MRHKVALSVLSGSALLGLIALGTARTDAQSDSRVARVAARQVKEVSKPLGWRFTSQEEFLMIVYGDPPNRVAIVRTEDGDVEIPLTSDFVLASELLSPSMKVGVPNALHTLLVWGIGDVQEDEDADMGLGSLSPEQLIELLRDGQTSFEVSPTVVRPVRLKSRNEVTVTAAQAPDARISSETEVAETIEGDAGEIDAEDTGVGGTAAAGECAYRKECPQGGGACIFVCSGSCGGWFASGICAEVTVTNPNNSTTTTCRCVGPAK